MTMLRREIALPVAFLIGLALFLFEHRLLALGLVGSFAASAALVALIVAVSVRVARHAEYLAHKVGDPYGTMILTLTAVLVEVVVLAIVMSSESAPTLVRDTIYSAVMIDINGIIGLAALVLAWRQSRGARSVRPSMAAQPA